MTGTMKRYVIERDIPGVGNMNREQLKQAACDLMQCAGEALRQGAVGAVIRCR
jgi:hypothetical protein